MTLARTSWRVSLPLLALALSTPALAQSYGLGDQVLVVGAAAFRPVLGTTTGYYEFDGYTFGEGDYVAPLTLPDGAEVFMVCLNADDPDALSDVTATIEAVGLAEPGQDPGTAMVVGSNVATNFDTGFGSVCSTPFSYTFHTNGQLDGSGVENLAHRVAVSIVGNAGLGAVRVFWRRQVSPPPPTPTFGDVPAFDGAYAYIEALVASGITAGCGGGNYCPDAPLTRRQMAVFLAKALGLHWQS
jgi:S-layer homology domain